MQGCRESATLGACALTWLHPRARDVSHLLVSPPPRRCRLELRCSPASMVRGR
jgi:hypothetical protein